jgi:hypothetical protein
MTRAHSSARCLLVVALVLLADSRLASAHVVLVAPNGGEALTGGATSQIRWQPAVMVHDTLNFDLWYSTVSASTDWISIVENLPPGDLTVGSNHSYAWTVPNISDSSVWVRVRQENDMDDDYFGFSAASFSITAAGLTGDYNDDDVVDGADYTVWRNAFGGPGGGLAADGNMNNQIDTGDYTVWRRHYGDSIDNGTATGAISAPEPGGIVLLLLLAGVRLRRRWG